MNLKLDYSSIRAMISPFAEKIRSKRYLTGMLANQMDWRRLLKISQDEVVGLDIGSSVVKMVQLQKNNACYKVIAAGIADIEKGDDSDDSAIEVNTAGAIHKCLESIGVQTRLAVCSVCGPEVAVRYFRFPLLPAEEVGPAVLLEAGQVCPFNIDDSSVDYQLIPDGEDNVSGILVAATNKLIERKRRLAEDASLSTVLVDVDGLALLNCFSEYRKVSSEDEVGQTAAILNVGSCFTNLAIMAGTASDNALPFVRDIAYGGDDIVKHVAAEHNLPIETVRKILFGCETLEQPQSGLGDSLARACQRLITDVAETLRYHTAQGKSAAVERVLVCGGFSLVEGFVELLDSRLPARASLWNPFDRMSCEDGRRWKDVLQKNGPAMAVAAGLAMRSI
jgi:type IV pilus assembly protein PilM